MTVDSLRENNYLLLQRLEISNQNSECWQLQKQLNLIITACYKLDAIITHVQLTKKTRINQNNTYKC